MISLRSFKVLSVSSFLIEVPPFCGLNGEVFAIFDHSCHVQMNDGRMVCIADARIENGPITVRAALPRHLDFKALGVRLGMPLRMEGEDWILGDEILLRLSGAARWVPPAISGFPSHATASRRMSTLCHGLERDVPEAGLAPLVRHAEDLAHGGQIILGSVSDLVHIASQRVAKIVEGVRAGRRRQIDDGVRGLIGLGPGLTPSGDDLLAGFMIGLITTSDLSDRAPKEWPPRRGLADLTAAIARTILIHATTGTTRLSNALLSYAVKGVGSDSVHRLLQALLQSNDAPEPTAAALKMTRTGHTSGWDCLAGILLGIHLGIRLSGTPAVSGDGFARLTTAV